MPAYSTTGFEHRIAADAPDLSASQVKRLAKKIAWRAAHMQEEFDYYAALRILGIYSDPTAKEAAA